MRKEDTAVKKVLIITLLYYYSETNVLVERLARYLPEFGWQPIILTASLSQKSAAPFKIIETPYRGTFGFLKKWLRISASDDIGAQFKKKMGLTSKKSRLLDFAFTRIGELFNYPDGDKGWKDFAIKAGSELLENEHVDAIISSSAPVTSHLVAIKLKHRYQIPWIADFRDLWSQNHNYNYSSLRKWFDRRLELKTMSDADSLVTVCEPLVEKLKALHRRQDVFSITMGFNPDTAYLRSNLTKKFTITYTGLIYTGKQEPNRLFAAVKDLISEGVLNPDDIEIRFYGPEMNWLPLETEKYGLSAITKFYGIVSHDIALEKQRESQILLTLNWEDPKISEFWPSKGYEYIATQRPILAIGGSGEDATKKFLNETGAGFYCKTIEDIKNTLGELYAEYKRTGKVHYINNTDKISKYSYREEARLFANVLDKVSHPNKEKQHG